MYRVPSLLYKDSTSSVVPCMARGRVGVQVLGTFKPQALQNLYSPASPCRHPQARLLIVSPKKQRTCRVPSRHTKQHKFCGPLHGPGGAGEYRFWALSGPKRSKTCTPPRPRAGTRKPAY